MVVWEECSWTFFNRSNSGHAVILGLAWLFSTDRRAIKLKTIAWGLGLQLALAFSFSFRCGSSCWFPRAGANKLLSFSYAVFRVSSGDIGQPQELSRLGLFRCRASRCSHDHLYSAFSACSSITSREQLISALAAGLDRVMRAPAQPIPHVAASISSGQTEARSVCLAPSFHTYQIGLMVVMTSGMAHISAA